MKSLSGIALIVLSLLFSAIPCRGSYDRNVEKRLKKQYREVTYIPHSDCYMVMSKSDRDYFGICNAAGTEIIPPVYKKCSFEKSSSGEVIIFAQHPNFKAPEQGNVIYSLKRGKILNIKTNEPTFIEGDFFTFYAQPIYNLSGNVVLDCQQTSVQPIRRSSRVIGYRIGTRTIINNVPQDELWICDAQFNHLFTLEGQAYLWKVEEANDGNGNFIWKCTKDNGSKELLTLTYSSDGTLISAPEPDPVKQPAAAIDLAENQPYKKPAAADAPKATTPTPAPTPTPTPSTTPSPTKQPTRTFSRSSVSDIDMNLPVSSIVADNTFAVIISNENYSEVEDVPFALNDGELMAKYCKSTLGLPEKNIRHIKNATLNQMKRQLHWLGQISEAYGKSAKIIFYYSGHGMPDEATGNAFLLPVDGYHSDMTTNLSVNDLYASLSALNVQQVTVFLDACFSGSQRGDKMLVAARGVKIKAHANAPKGKLIVMSAAQANETAYPYDDKKHGMFTYFLLKKIRETGSSVNLGELGDYIIDQVRKTSLIQNDKIQTPTLSISSEITDDWRSLTL